MGGIIVVDFIDMHSNDHKIQLHEKMKDAMASDRTKHNILPLSKFGLMQITRQRVRPELSLETLETCPVCKGSGEVGASILIIDEIYNNLVYLTGNKLHKSIQLRVHPYVSAYLLKGLISLRLKWFFKLGKWIKIKSVDSYSLLDYKFYNNAGDRIKE
jgi:ribonuclease G